MPDLTAPETPASMKAERRPVVPPPEEQLGARIDEWVTQGIITPEQAARIRDSESHGTRGPVTSVHPPRSSLVVEALGYLGGVIVVVSTMLIAAQYWSEITTAWRLIIVGVAVAGLLAGGVAVPERLGAAGERLRSVLWLGSTAAASGFLAVLGHDVLTMAEADAVLLNAAGSTTFAALLWSRHRVIPQQVAMMVGAMIVAGAAIADFVTMEGLPGVGVWGVAVVWLLLGWGGLLGPRRAAVALGAVGALVGATITMADDAGIAFAIGTAAAIVLTAVLTRDLVLLVVGGFGALQVLPTALTRWFPDSQAAPFGLLGLGPCSWAWRCGLPDAGCDAPRSPGCRGTSPPGAQRSRWGPPRPWSSWSPGPSW